MNVIVLMRTMNAATLILVDLFTLTEYFAMNVGPCHHGMARPQVADGGTASNMEVAVNKLNKQPRTADEGWSSSLGGLDEVLTTPLRKKTTVKNYP
jgi:hypothetical protein